MTEARLPSEFDVDIPELTENNEKKNDSLVVRLPVRLKNALHGAAFNANMTSTGLIRKLIEEYLEKVK